MSDKPSERKRPLIDRTDDEIKARLRHLYANGTYVQSPSDYYRELERRAMKRYAKVSTVASVVSAVVATAAVVMSAIALFAR